MLKFGFGDVEGAVLGMHGAETSVVSARFRYFQRLRFPSGTNTGRGRPASYGLEQMLQIVLAFELLNAGLGPTPVVRTIRTNWPRLRVSLLLGWEAACDRIDWDQREIFLLEPTALLDGARSDDAFEAVENPLEPVPALTAAGWARGRDGPPAMIIVDPARMLANFARVIPQISVITLADLEEGFSALEQP